MASSFTELGAKVFMGADAARTVAIVACYPGEGATYVSHALQGFLTEEAGSSASLVSADEFLDSPAAEEARGTDTPEGERRSRPGQGIVLIDCPSLFSSATAVRLAPHVDGILLVIRDGERSKANIQRAVSMLEAAQGRVLGAVLNRRIYSLPDWLYSLVR